MYALIAPELPPTPEERRKTMLARASMASFMKGGSEAEAGMLDEGEEEDDMGAVDPSQPEPFPP